MKKTFLNKKIQKILLALFLVLVAIFIIGYSLFLSRVPQMKGELSLQHLTQEVLVDRDQYGIPHITAQNRLDAFRALGYVMAQERLFQFEVSRRLAQGELAEILGEKFLKSDKLFRNLRIKQHAEEIVSTHLKNNLYNPQMLAEANAYYDGVNQFVKEGKTPIEFLILGIKPREFSLVDGMSFAGLMGYSFGIATMTDPMFTQMLKEFPMEVVDELRNEKINPLKTITAQVDGGAQKTNLVHLKVLSVIEDLEKSFTLFEGSNGWLLDKKRSKTGANILANDPHISYSHPGVWFEAHLKTPEFEIYGHFLPAIPFPVLGKNHDKAWGLTMTLTDDTDLYQEMVDYDKKMYRFMGTDLPLTEESVEIKIKGQESLKYQIFSTHHGPILKDVIEDKTYTDLAFQWSYYRMENDPFSALYEMLNSKNMQEFKNGVKKGISPGLNILYADKENIAWWMFGEVSRKRKGLSTDFILNGSSGEDEIIEVLPFEKKPFLENPSSGIIISANTRPKDYPKDIRGDWQADDRYKTLEALFSQKEVWSLDEIKEIQSLGLNLENKLIMEVLLKDSAEFIATAEGQKYQQVIKTLSEWNLVSDKDKIAPTLFYNWTRTLLKTLLNKLTPEQLKIMLKVPNGQIFLRRVLLDEKSPWWLYASRKTAVVESLKASVGELETNLGKNQEKWQWGKWHTIEFKHPIGNVKPLNKIFNLGPYPISGATHEIDNEKSNSVSGPFEVMAGPSTRRVIDFSQTDYSWGILPVGNSGHLLSPFYKDQLLLFLKGEYRKAFLNLDQKEIKYSLKMVPKN